MPIYQVVHNNKLGITKVFPLRGSIHTRRLDLVAIRSFAGDDMSNIIIFIARYKVRTIESYNAIAS